MFLVALGLLLVALGSRRGETVDLLPGLAAIGVGSGLAVPLTTRALESAPDRLSGIAAGLFSATHEASGVFGIAVVGLIVTSVQRSVSSTGAGSGHAFLMGYQAGLCTAAALVAIGVPVALWGLRTHVHPAGLLRHGRSRGLEMRISHEVRVVPAPAGWTPGRGDADPVEASGPAASHLPDGPLPVATRPRPPVRGPVWSCGLRAATRPMCQGVDGHG